MTPISATDAIAPAFRRTRALIAQPFRLGFFLKLVIVATFSESNLIAMGILLPMQASSLLFQFLMARNGSSGGSTSSSPFPLPQFPSGNFGTAFLLIAAGGALVYLLLCVVFFYLFTRFRFIVFDAVLFGERKFSRAWAKYGSQTWRYYGLSILIAMACMLVATAVASPIVLVSLRMLRSAGSGSTTAFGSMVGYFLLTAMLQYALIFVAIVADGLLRDFLMPPMAIEDAGIERSFARFADTVRKDPAGVFVFTLLRFVLRIALGIGLFVAVIIPVLVLGLIFFGAGFVLYHPLWGAGIGGQVVFGVYAVVAAIAEFVLYLAAIFTVGGVLSVFTQAYALIFYADRYPELGNILNPPPPAAAIAPASSPQAEPPPETQPPPFLPEPPAVW